MILPRPVLGLKWQTQPVPPWVRLQAPISPTHLLTSLPPSLPTYLVTCHPSTWTVRTKSILPRYLPRYLGGQLTPFRRRESRKSDRYRINPSISHHTALTLHLVWDTVAMPCGSKSGDFEIGELTSISSPGRLVGSSAGSEESGSSSSSPLLGDSPDSPFCFPFSNAHPSLSGPFEPLLREEPASHQELGERLFILGDSRRSARGRVRQCIAYCFRILCARISDGAL